ncbi:hypothetical protein L195_g018850 [Trifolium pratense]|uniref:Uncharacterized protein n=1 Tax=Trifolium pratense TaxID=57577 RepID=A0A2K3MXZ0_TRIPR|nr:hypothetical protein L195_g018850 [Trifolium pratense]
MYKLLLAPICCMSVVHYHTPHYVHKQFEELEVVDVNQIMWELPRYEKSKENRGPMAQKFLSDFELQLWNEGRLVINYLKGHEDDGMVDQHVENVTDNQPEASNSRDVDSLVHVVDQPETCIVDQLGRHVEPESSIHADTQCDPHQESSILSRSLLGGDNNEDEGRMEDQSDDMAATGSSCATLNVYKRCIKSNTEKEENTKKKMKTNENEKVEVEHSLYLLKELLPYLKQLSQEERTD